MKNVLVMMSTFNGAKYLKVQLDSIFNQIGVNIHCIIRDDGSSDLTKNFLLDYKKSNKNLTLFFEKNIGWAESFFRLISLSNNKYDYFAFSDQDDFWMKDKIISSIKKLEVSKNDTPSLYFSNLKVVDKNLLWDGFSYMNYNMTLSKPSSIVENVSTGCTQVFNKSLMNLLKLYKPIPVRAHDHWVYLVALFLGQVIYDSDSHILYRQHSSNALGASIKPLKVIKNRLKVLLSLYDKKRYNYKQFKLMSLNLLNGYMSFLSEVDTKLLSKIAYYDKNLTSKLALILDNQISRKGFIPNLGLKIRIILGIL